MLIGVGGKAGAGKDTIGDHLVAKYGFKKIALADPIKRLVKDVFVLSDEEVYDREKREQPMEKWGGRSVRQLLQYIGTELFRENVDEEIWVKSLWFRVENDPNFNYVVTDVRFPNELEYLSKSAGKDFVFIKVEREGCDGQVGIVQPERSSFKKFLDYLCMRTPKKTVHASEAYDLKAAHVIENNSTFEDLYIEVEAIAECYLPKDFVEKIERSV